LIVPSTAVAAAWANLAEKHHPVLDVLLHLPVTVIDNLDELRAKTIGQLGGAQTDAHAIACALDRRWPLLTADPAQYTAYRDLGVDFEPLT
jgi:predicted nucleic acid-binding protein